MPKTTLAAGAIRARFPGDWYIAFHAPRFVTLLRTLDDFHRPGARVLDIGTSPATALIAEHLGHPVDSLGFGPDAATPSGRHFELNLNDCQHRERWRPDLGPYDLVVMAEVIEHLHTSPTWILSFLRTLLEPGGFLVIQTPNAVALHKRLLMLAGRNPYELIREGADNPGHFREYTRKELLRYAAATGFQTARVFAGNYFDYAFLDQGRHQGRLSGALLRAVRFAYHFIPANLKPAITLVLRHGPAP